MEPIPLSCLACLSCSVNGTTYGVASSASPFTGHVAVLDPRPSFLSAGVRAHTAGIDGSH